MGAAALDVDVCAVPAVQWHDTADLAQPAACNSPLFWLAMVGFMEPGSLVMERKMLYGIRERAERLHRSGAHEPATAEHGLPSDRLPA